MLSLNKYFKTSKLLIVVCLFLLKNSTAQNLVQNGSFENYNMLYCNGAGFDLPNWNYLNSPDYYTTLYPLTGGGGVPANMGGYTFPKNGNEYAGLLTIAYPYETKEYIYQQLTTPLVAGKTYYTGFYLSKSDRTRIATEKIGAWFSTGVPVAPSNTYVTAIPQVENHSGFLTDTVNWVKIEGYFMAQGGEQYMTIGNFNSNANTDTLHTGTTNPFFADAGTAYYYIDSVSLYDSVNMPMGFNEKSNVAAFTVYPNPANDMIHIEFGVLNERENLQIKITDVLGRETLVSEYKEQLDISYLEKGIYFLSVYKNETYLGTKKIVRE